VSGLVSPKKTCPDSGLEKDAAEFGRNKRRADGLAQYLQGMLRTPDNPWLLRRAIEY
jgi:hypothetical protein